MSQQQELPSVASIILSTLNIAAKAGSSRSPRASELHSTIADSRVVTTPANTGGLANPLLTSLPVGGRANYGPRHHLCRPKIVRGHAAPNSLIHLLTVSPYLFSIIAYLEMPVTGPS